MIPWKQEALVALNILIEIELVLTKRKRGLCQISLSEEK